MLYRNKLGERVQVDKSSKNAVKGKLIAILSFKTMKLGEFQCHLRKSMN